MNLPRPFISLILWTAMFCCFLLPLRAYDGHFFLAGFVLLTLGTVYRIWQWTSDDGLSIPKSPFLILFGIFWFIGLITAMTSDVSFISMIFFGFFSVLPMSFIYFTSEPFDKDFLKYAFVIAGILFALVSANLIYHYYFRPEMLYNGRAHYPLANPNSMAGLLSLGFFAFYGLFLYTKDTRIKILTFCLITLIMLGFFTTGSRGASATLLVGLIGFNAITFKFFKTHAKKNALILLSIFTTGAFILIDATLRNTPSMVKMTTGQLKSGYPMLGERQYIWESTINIIRDNLWTGTGLGSFFLYYPEYRTGDTASAGLMAHNDILQFWSEMGILSPIVFLVLIGYVVYKTFSVLPRILDNHEMMLKVLIPFCALGTMILHAQITFHFHILPILFFSGALIAVWFTTIERITPSRPYRIDPNDRSDIISTKLILSVLCLSYLTIYVSFQGSELMIRHAKTYVQKHKNIKAFDRWIDRAMAFSFHQNARAFALKATVPSSLIRSGTPLPEQHRYQFFKQAESLLNTAIALNGRMASFRYELSLLAEYGQERYPEDAKNMPSPVDIMAEAHRLDPLYANTTKRYAELLINDGQDRKAYEVLKGQLHWHYTGQNPISYFQMTVKLAEQFDDTETADRARQLTIRHLKKQHTAKHRARDLKR